MTANHLTVESVESYSTHRLPRSEVERVEEHMLTCEGCRGLILEELMFISAVRRAAARVGWKRQPHFRSERALACAQGA